MTRESASPQTTDNARLEAALADNENLRRMASSFAHDFNNLLAVIVGYSELMLRKLRPDDPLRGRVESIKKATEWGITLAQQILAASRKQGTTAATASVSLNQAVTNVTRVLQPALGERIELVTRLDPAAGQVVVNQGQLGQVIMNLVVNARDAMPEGGRLVVETAAAGAEVVLSVSDTGVGMDDETRARLFEPYFTTKEPGKGMGLGLATVYDVVTRNAGRIEVASEPGRGSTFLIFLPRAADDGEGAPGIPSGAPAAVTPLTVLVVEDECEVRALIREILQLDRHRVLEARDRDEALALSERHEGPIDLLIVDVVLPGSITDDLVRRLTASRPGIRVLYVSGYLDDTEEVQSILRVGRVVQKPFTVAALTQAVREVLIGAT